MQHPTTIITFASPKGGVGKSTCCLAIAGALAARGNHVHIIDFDRSRTLHRWYTSNRSTIDNATDKLTVEAATPDNFLARIKSNYHEGRGFVLIDVAGHFDELMLRAAAVAALTITPAKLNEPDIIEASKLHGQMVQMARSAGKPAVEHRVLINEVLPLLPTHQRQTLDQLATNTTIKRFDTLIYSRAAYSEAYLSGLPPHFSDQTRPAIRKATEELDALFAEILSVLNLDQVKAEAA
jgi:chromosome partitioning protein